MAVALTATFEVKGQGNYTNPLDLSTPSDRLLIGAGNFDAISDTFSTGTGATAGAADLWFHDERTVGATSNDNLDLSGSLTNPITGATLAFARVKLVIIDLDAPATGVFLSVGPGVTGTSNAWVGWFADASDYMKVYDTLYISNRTDGFGSISNGATDKLCIYNSTGSSIVYRILIVGSSS